MNQIFFQNEMRKANDEVIKLKNELYNLKKPNFSNHLIYQSQISNNSSNSSNSQNQIYNLEQLNMKYQLLLKENKLLLKENIELKSKIERKKNTSVNYASVYVINFYSGDGQINMGIKCLPTETFAEVEERLYKEYDNYRNTDNYFIANGQKVSRFKTINENKIGNGTKVQLIKLE